MAHRTNTVLCLVGSYQLLDILARAPHLLGRQRLIEFPRYRANDSEDIKAFGQILQAWSTLFRFDDPQTTLRSWRRLLFTHSFGCIGHLSKWLRSTLGEISAGKLNAVTESLLRSTRHPASQEAAIAAEIEAGELAISRSDLPVVARSNDTPRKTSRKPFQRATRRFDIDGRR
jgi:hypothetical protein